MADQFDCAAPDLLCSENSNLCFDDHVIPSSPLHAHDPNPILNSDRSDSFIVLPLQNDESVSVMVEREGELSPRDDYLKRLRSGELSLGFRSEAIDWILKAHTRLNFEPLSACLSVNFLDRFLSVHELPRGKPWTGQLLAVACLSLAAKMEEIEVPPSVELQVGDPLFVFDAKNIQRMELLVLSTLKWRMRAFTPLSFIDYFLNKINGEHVPLRLLIFRSIRLIMSTSKVIDFLEFKPSEIAAAVAIFLSSEIQAVDIDKATSSFISVEKDRLVKCLNLIRNLFRTNGDVNWGRSGLAASVPQSPVGVLDAACLSYRTNDITVGSCANYSQNTENGPAAKRRIIDKSSAFSFKS